MSFTGCFGAAGKGILSELLLSGAPVAAIYARTSGKGN